MQTRTMKSLQFNSYDSPILMDDLGPCLQSFRLNMSSKENKVYVPNLDTLLMPKKKCYKERTAYRVPSGRR